MAHEIDGQGNIKVFTFFVLYDLGEESKRRFVDYADGWNWARGIVGEYETQSDDHSARIHWDYDWIAESDVEDYISEINED